MQQITQCQFFLTHLIMDRRKIVTKEVIETSILLVPLTTLLVKRIV